MLIGFTNNAKLYKLWDIELRKVVYSRDVEIIKGKFHTFDNNSTKVEELDPKKDELSESDKDSGSDSKSE